MGGWANKNQFGSAKLIFWGRGGGGVCGGVAGGGGGGGGLCAPCESLPAGQQQDDFTCSSCPGKRKHSQTSVWISKTDFEAWICVPGG